MNIDKVKKIFAKNTFKTLGQIFKKLAEETEEVRQKEEKVEQ